MATDLIGLPSNSVRLLRQPFVDAVGQQQDFDAFLAEDFEVRAVLGGGEAVGGDEVDGFLAFLHAADVVLERDDLRVGVGVGGGKAQQAGDAVLVGEVFARAFLQHLAELFPERDVFLGLVLGQVFQQAQHFFHRAGLDGVDVAARLQDLARDVERQVGRVDHPAHEAQVLRHQLLGVVHDEDAAHVELDAVAAVAVVEVERRVGGHIQQRDVFLLAFDRLCDQASGGSKSWATCL